jgi:hypothetical protein
MRDTSRQRSGVNDVSLSGRGRQFKTSASRAAIRCRGDPYAMTKKKSTTPDDPVARQRTGYPVRRRPT